MPCCESELPIKLLFLKHHLYNLVNNVRTHYYVLVYTGHWIFCGNSYAVMQMRYFTSKMDVEVLVHLVFFTSSQKEHLSMLGLVVLYVSIQWFNRL